MSTTVLAIDTRSLPTARTRWTDNAFSTLLVHVVGPEGFCAGCADQAQFALAPCPMARQARSFIETHGVAVWDSWRTAGAVGEYDVAAVSAIHADKPLSLLPIV